MKRWLFLLACSGLVRAEPLSLTHARLPDGSRGTVVIQDDRIVSVGPASPQAAIDLTGLYLYPGLVESDSTLGLVEIESVRGGTDTKEVGQDNADLQAEIAFNPDSELLPVARSAGILTVGLQPAGGRISGQVSVLSLSGWTREDMRLAPSPGVVVQWPTWSGEKDKARQQWDENLEEFRDRIEEARAWQQLPAAERPVQPPVQALADVLARRGKLFVHAHKRYQIESALKFCREEHLRWVLVGGAEAGPCASALAQDKVDVIYTDVYREPERDYEDFDLYYRTAGQLAKAGVRVALAGPGSHDNARWLPEMAATAWRYGWSEKDAIDAITKAPCEILGIPHQGEIRAGETATLIATDRPLLDPRCRVVRAWVQGREIDLTDRQKKLYERYKKRALTRPGSASDNQPMIPDRLPSGPPSKISRPVSAPGGSEPQVEAQRETFEPGPPAWGQSLTGDIRYHEVASEILGNRRQVWVYLPPSYGQDPERRYPVVYAMDGQNVFERGTAFGGQEWGMDEAAQRAMTQHTMQDAIIVAVSNAGAERLNEYSPVPDPHHGGGGAPQFARFLKEELKPMIDGAYRTETGRENTAVLGSSMGALVSLYLGLAHADTFGLIGALSPSLWWAQQDMLKQWAAHPPAQAPAKLWLDIGDREGDDDDHNGIPDPLEHTRSFAGLLASQGQQGLMFHEIPGGTHTEAAWRARIQDVLEGLLPPQ